MSIDRGSWAGRLTPALTAAGLVLLPLAAHGAVLRQAHVEVRFTAPAQCEVRASFTLDTAEVPQFEHRIHLLEGATVAGPSIEGTAVQVGEPETRGRARWLRLHGTAPREQRYALQYAVAQPPEGVYRCPLWLPTIPADGRSHEVTIRVSLPPGTVPGGSALPAFAWAEGAGSARLGHVPAFVRVPFHPAGAADRAIPDVTRLMDLVAIAGLVAGMLLFAWRRRRR